ncbi:MAG: hypothetical protein H8D23_25760 [Candidatus Brocadiales bacterium]|nr:hypothetical protein [Candidatus Brocadiales bacterium]
MLNPKKFPIISESGIFGIAVSILKKLEEVDSLSAAKPIILQKMNKKTRIGVYNLLILGFMHLFEHIIV